MKKNETEKRITPALLCQAYALGLFPMAQSRASRELMWVEPQIRGILPLDKFRLSRRDERALRKANFTVTINRDFSAVVRGCAERLREQNNSCAAASDSSISDNQVRASSASDNQVCDNQVRDNSACDNQVCDNQVRANSACDNQVCDTWINAEIEQLYGELHRQGFAHSIEVYAQLEATKGAAKEGEVEGAKEGGVQLVGGLYGVALGAAFFGESMFSNQSNASKAALRYLVERLRACKYQLLDVQFKTPHLERFGVLEISQQKYRERLDIALQEKRRLQ